MSGGDELSQCRKIAAKYPAFLSLLVMESTIFLYMKTNSI